MDIKKIMSGIAVAIDDALGKERSVENEDKIFQLVNSIEKEWKIPFYKASQIPPDDICDNLLQSASFILLDWKLWQDGAPELEQEGIKGNINFLKKAKDYFVPVFIFTNEASEDIIDEISRHDLYDEKRPGKNFIFIRKKNSLTGKKVFTSINNWVSKNDSVYTLKVWEQAFYKAKDDLFSSMYKRSPDWPRIFWSSYRKDGADPSSSMVNLINNNMIAHMETNIFEKSVLDKRGYQSDSGDIKSVLEGASFISKTKLPNSIGSGDMFKCKGKYFVNIRADCDCIPRQGETIDDIDLFLIKGRSLSSNQVKKQYDNGRFNERTSNSIVFAVDRGKTIQFDFRNLIQKPFRELKENRIGRLIHPYITRIQQRYALYLQRQGLPRIPDKAINPGGKT